MSIKNYDKTINNYKKTKTNFDLPLKINPIKADFNSLKKQNSQ